MLKYFLYPSILSGSSQIVHCSCQNSQKNGQPFMEQFQANCNLVIYFQSMYNKNIYFPIFLDVCQLSSQINSSQEMMVQWPLLVSFHGYLNEVQTQHVPMRLKAIYNSPRNIGFQVISKVAKYPKVFQSRYRVLRCPTKYRNLCMDTKVY